jgi:TPR repeat protein
MHGLVFRGLTIVVALLAVGGGAALAEGWVMAPDPYADHTYDRSRLRPLAERGDPYAQYNLGEMFDSGRVFQEDDREALKWYRRAAEQGFAPAQYNLGSMYRTGHIVAKDLTLARMWYDLAASPSHGDNAKAPPDGLDAMMTPAAVDRAREMARRCLASRYSDCP